MMSNPVSGRMRAVQAPIIPVIAAMIREHPGGISMGQGVAWYGPPRRALERMREFGERPDQHRYGPVEGLPELRALMAEKLERENGISLVGRSVLVTAGANMGFLNALFAIADAGDEIILPSPYYFNQEMAVRMLGCTPVPAPTDDRFQLDLDCLERAITPRTRAIVTISPNNPSGAVYPEADLAAVNALCRARGLFHITDETYECFVYEGARHFSPASLPNSVAHTISLYSLSKAYGFAGWRIGYMLIPKMLEPAVLKVQDTNLICAPLVCQHAAVGAMETGSAYCREKLATTARVRRIVLDALSGLGERCHVADAQGAFYVLIRVEGGGDALTLAERLIREFGVAVIPGTAFGLDGGCYLRIAYGALGPTTAEEGIGRLVHGLRTILDSR
ncbi:MULTISPECIES: pyridoxal phosphate-dependent aminotransferase [Methylococcus]|uniref:Aminotransferase n=1 Tax=Methylococcus capsulatus TaxID=414 RepID=A0ABZ2F456_METCP|nr:MULTISPECIES: pyridoxal phosphate-dependent aminotransferase [Methylococcus]MDF9391937.1 pyridoxal phosphate-dependent aminotransferase [Methylococcus capsulatus]